MDPSYAKQGFQQKPSDQQHHELKKQEESKRDNPDLGAGERISAAFGAAKQSIMEAFSGTTVGKAVDKLDRLDKVGEVGAWRVVDMKKEDLSVMDIGALYQCIRLHMAYYLQDHVNMALSGDPNGIIRKFHDSVVKANLDLFLGVWQGAGMTIPFPQVLEGREQEIKSKMAGVQSNVLSEGEIAFDLLTRCNMLQMAYTQARMGAVSSDVRKAFTTASKHVDSIYETMGMRSFFSDNFYPPPLARVVVEVQGVNARK